MVPRPTPLTLARPSILLNPTPITRIFLRVCCRSIAATHSAVLSVRLCAVLGQSDEVLQHLCDSRRHSKCGLDLDFQEVVHPVRTEEAEVAKLQCSAEDRMNIHKNAPLTPKGRQAMVRG